MIVHDLSRGRQITHVTCLNSIRRLEDRLGCTFEFSIRPKPFRLKVNRSNAVSSRTGAIDRDCSGFEAISRQRYGK
jgi:hypothetical protein